MDKTTIRLVLYDRAFAEEAYAYIQEMIKAISMNGGEVLPLQDDLALSVGYRHQYMRYRRKAKEYTEPIKEAQRLLALLTLDGTRITINDCGDLQGPLDMDGDFYSEFFIQLCFLTTTMALLRGYQKQFFCTLSGCGDGSFTRAEFDDAFLRIDINRSESMNDRYEWEYREGYGGFGELKYSRFACEVKRIYVTDVPAFRDDDEIKAKMFAIREELGERGRIMLRLPSAEPIVHVMVEADTEGLCRQSMEAFLALIREKGYRVSEEDLP